MRKNVGLLTGPMLGAVFTLTAAAMLPGLPGAAFANGNHTPAENAALASAATHQSLIRVEETGGAPSQEEHQDRPRQVRPRRVSARCSRRHGFEPCGRRRGRLECEPRLPSRPQDRRSQRLLLRRQRRAVRHLRNLHRARDRRPREPSEPPDHRLDHQGRNAEPDGCLDGQRQEPDRLGARRQHRPPVRQRPLRNDNEGQVGRRGDREVREIGSRDRHQHAEHRSRRAGHAQGHDRRSAAHGLEAARLQPRRLDQRRQLCNRAS